MSATPAGVLLLAYGTPETLDEVEPYFRHIRGGRQPLPDAVELLRRRYEQIGGRTPLLDITRATAAGLQQALDARAPGAYRTYVAMKHWHPFIADVVPQMAEDGVRRLVAIVLAPHYSRMSIGTYRGYLDKALARLETAPTVAFVESWHRHDGFIALVAARIRDALAALPAGARDRACVLFSAHSLPEKIRTWNDPYETQLLESCAAAAAAAGIEGWRFAWQSAAATGEPWLGPDVLATLEALSSEGVRHVVSVPIGFVCDHLEVLYDIDFEARARAAALGIDLHRTDMPNASPELIAVLDDLVAQAEGGAAFPAAS